MSVADSAQAFDVDALRAGIEGRDIVKLSDLYRQDARVTLVDRRDQPSNPQEISGKVAISDFLDDFGKTENKHRLDDVLVSPDGTHASYLEKCRYLDGTRVLSTSILELLDGKIASQTILQAWDEPEGESPAAHAQRLNFAQPHELRSLGNRGEVEILHAKAGTVGRLKLQPGWRWSTDVKPAAGTEWCEFLHFQYQVSGTLRIHTADGTEFDSVVGDLVALPPGHDAWVVGDEMVVLVDFQGAHYGERA